MSRAKSKKLKQKERQRLYLLKKASHPCFNVAKTFTAKQIHVIGVKDDAPLIMKHQRKAAGACLHCGSKENLHVHHKDKNHENNRLENLLVLCAKCHNHLHLELKALAIQS